MPLNPFRPSEGSLTYEEEYRGNYKPNATELWRGLQIIAPDTPYVVAAGRNKLYFIDTRFDPESARQIREQIERATVPGQDEVISIDEISATAGVKNTLAGGTVFVRSPHARVLFAKGINRRNPELKLPQHESPVIGW
ncbi:hypothetical protein CCHL11_04780 [Colletotrichum chlorophyti]|uniref:Uncharacterized protein n=1 Tax=Colletotrichum chlorophyti TaxID=708187 RepID=A0A1Q8S1R1_9PEZI|nr:hypothetical protein CCHL11_04780 [Colletotrichum chlorophyti]